MLKISEDVLERLAEEVKDEETIRKLIDCPYYSVIKIIIQKPETSKAIREEIYSKWRGRADMFYFPRDLAEYQLNAETIHRLTEWCRGYEDLCRLLVFQEDILLEDLKFIYTTLTAGNLVKEEVTEILSNMAERDDLDQELMQKLVDYSPEVAARVALHHSAVIKVDFSKRKTQ